MTKGRTIVVALLALLLAVPAVAPAQGGGGGNSGGGGGNRFSTGGDSGQRNSSPWNEFKLDPKKRIKLNYRNASIDGVIEFFSSQSGVTILKDPKLTQKVTIISPNEVSLSEAFEILNAQLGLMGYQMEKSGSLLVIKARREDNGFGGMNMQDIWNAANGGQDRQQAELRVYRIKYANATEVARVINEVFYQRDQANNPFQFAFGGFNQGRGGRNNNNRFGGGFNPAQFGGQGQQGPTVRASSDDYSNTVIVNAPKNQQFEVEALIEEIDQETDAPQISKVYKLEFAFAADMAPTIQSILAANENTGRGGQNNSNNNFFQQFNRQRQGITSGGAVVADSYTNSLVVTATQQNQTVIADVIKELDKEVEYVDSAFVLPLSNARADDVATLLNQAFGTRNNGRTNTGRNNTGRTNTGGNRNTGNNGGGRQNGGGGGGGGGGFGGLQSSTEDPNNMALDLEDPDADFGDLLTQVSYGTDLLAQQFGQIRQNQGNQQNQGTVRGPGGQIVNARQAQGQVTIIADPQTNSIIVVGDPENAELIRSILAQLDKIPEQVMIETIIVEATLDANTKMGIEWDIASGKFLGNSGVTGNGNTDFGLQTNPLPQGFRYAVTGGNLGGFLNALKTDDKFKVLSTPRIFTSNNVQAEINISQSIPYIVSQREDVNGNFIFNYAFQDVGIILTVTPRITSNGMVTLDVVQTANDLQGFTDFNAPIVNQRQAQTTVSAKDGDTIVLGGIMRTQVKSTTKKVPLLGDIPILGNLFKSTSREDQKTELLVFLTPRVVRNPDEAKQLKDDNVSQLSNAARQLYDRSRPPQTNGGAGTTGGTTTGGSGGR